MPALGGVTLLLAIVFILYHFGLKFGGGLAAKVFKLCVCGFTIGLKSRSAKGVTCNILQIGSWFCLQLTCNLLRVLFSILPYLEKRESDLLSASPL
jgi:hypothetical protein